MIEIKNVVKTFNSGGKGLEALKGISLHIKPGEIFGIIGLSGAGKSTLLRTINRLGEPDSGEIRLGGTDVTKLAPVELRNLRKKVGMIFQHFNLLSSRTVSGNVAFALEVGKWPKRDIPRRVAEMLELVGLSDKADSYPSELSGGQKQRVGIARALANKPSVLLSDEATSALDPKTTQSILALLEDINRKMGITVVLVTHEMGVIRQICHRVAVLEAGRVVEQGRVRDIFMKPRSRTARELLSHLPRMSYDADKLPKEPGKPVVSFSFNGGTADQPIISRAIKTTGAEINILSGEIDNLPASKVGSLTVQLSGTQEEIAGALSYIRSQNVETEVIWNG
ncbi:MAG TPA: methionine ABC transporter ATP-binding protein [Synergistaceae bacterium]|nr:MAG: ABC transporter related protein [Synergistales bacterium 57_84]KUK86482.1 MAG: ABC transporter related protein [Synergistales bacterium 58_81]HBG14350.1 methionine ABC transporter ATP-binding protein [Synergistaceae bacterium]